MQPAAHPEQYKTKPNIQCIELFVDWVSRDIISNHSYHVWVDERAQKKEEWAKDMNTAVDRVKSFIVFWCNYIDIISRRRNGGMSDLCKILHTALPVSRSSMSLMIQKCAVTRQNNRPCFEVVSTKPLETPIFIHHSLCNVYQTMWSLRNINEIINHSLQVFQRNNTDKTLNEICTSYDKDPERTKLISYIDFICNDIVVILTQDNVFAM